MAVMSFQVLPVYLTATNSFSFRRGGTNGLEFIGLLADQHPVDRLSQSAGQV